MGEVFGTQLKKWRERAGLSGNRLALLAGILQGTLSHLERGMRPPSRSNVEAIAGVAELGLTVDEVQAWADLDQIGVDGYRRIQRYAATALGEMLNAPPGHLPEVVDLDALTGGARPLTPKERAIVERLLVVTGGDLVSIQLGPDAPEWTFEKGKRLAVLQEILVRLDRPATGKAREELA